MKLEEKTKDQGKPLTETNNMELRAIKFQLEMMCNQKQELIEK